MTRSQMASLIEFSRLPCSLTTTTIMALTITETSISTQILAAQSIIRPKTGVRTENTVEELEHTKLGVIRVE